MNEPVVEGKDGRGWVCRHPVAAFYICTLAFSWSLWGLMILSSRGLMPFRFPTNFLGSFGPAAGAVITTGFIGGRPAIKSLLRSVVNVRMAGRFYLFALLLPALLYIVAVALASIWTGSIPVVNLQQWFMVFPILIVILIVGGPLGEEIGWRGFLLPRLLQRWNPLISSFLLALLWFLWHVPLFYLQGSAQEDSSVAGYSLFFVSISVLFTWLYNRTNGNLFAAILFHTGLNTASICYPEVFTELAKGKVVDYIFLSLTWIAALIVILLAGTRLGSKDPESSVVTIV